MACIVWKVLTSRQPYRDEDKRLTARKRRILAWKAKRPEMKEQRNIRQLAETLEDDAAILEKYQEGFDAQ
jgi:hypothetical protein